MRYLRFLAHQFFTLDETGPLKVYSLRTNNCASGDFASNLSSSAITVASSANSSCTPATFSCGGAVPGRALLYAPPTGPPIKIATNATVQIHFCFRLAPG